MLDINRVGPGPDRPAAHEALAIPEWAVEPLAIAKVLCQADGRLWDSLEGSEIDRYFAKGVLELERLRKAAA